MPILARSRLFLTNTTVATNPKPLRGLAFEHWLAERKARHEHQQDMSWLGRWFMDDSKALGILYQRYLKYQKLIASFTEAGYQGYNSNGQWLRRQSKRKRRAWKPKSS